MYKSFFPYFYRNMCTGSHFGDSNLAPLCQPPRLDLLQGGQSLGLRDSIEERVQLSLSLCPNFKFSSFKRLRKLFLFKNPMVFQKLSTDTIYSSAKRPLEKNFKEKGFFTVMGLGLLLILLMMSGALVTIGFIAHKKMTLSSHCVHSVLTLQKGLKKPLEKLLKMNKKANALRVKRKIALARLAAATASGIVPAIAAAKAQLFFITQKQLLFKAKQQLLFFEARTLREKFKYKSLSPNISRQVNFAGESGDLALTPHPPSSLSPSYRPTDNFLENQGQSYALNHQLFLPQLSLIKFFTDTKPWSIKAKCSASLKPKGVNQWLPTLKKVKESWRLSYGSF